MKVFNFSMKNIRPTHSQPKNHFGGSGDKFSQDENSHILKNTFIENALKRQDESMHSHIAQLKNPRIKVNSIVQNLTRIDSCNKRLAMAVANNKLINNFNSESKIGKMIARPSADLFKENQAENAH